MPIFKETAESTTLKQKIQNKLDQLFKFLKQKYCAESLVVGVDIRPTIIRIAVSEEVDGIWKVKNLYSKTISNKFNQENLEKSKSSYIVALKDLIAENKIKNQNVAIALPTSLSIIKNVSIPLMSDENFHKATKISSFWQNIVQITDNLKDYSIFYKVTARREADSEMDILFVALKQKDIKIYTDIINAAGLEVLVVDVSCFSLNNLAKLKESSLAEAPDKAVMKIGSDENFLQIFDGEKPYIYDIFVPENEKLYINEYIEDSTFQTRFIAQVKHIIAKHKEKYNVGISQLQVIVASKNVSTFLDNLRSSMEGVEVSLSHLFDGISFSKEIHKKLDISAEEEQTEGQNLSKNEWATAIGLSTRRLKLFSDKNDIAISDKVNLANNYEANTERLKAKFISKIVLSLTSAILGALLILLAIIFFAQYQIRLAEVRKFNKLNTEHIQKSAEFKTITEDSTQLTRLIKANESVGSNQDVIINALNDLSAMIPDGVWLDKLEFNSGTGIVKIYGSAYDEKNILKFSRTLDDSNVIKQSLIESMKAKTSDTGATTREYVISARYAEPPKVEDKKAKGKGKAAAKTPAKGKE